MQQLEKESLLVTNKITGWIIVVLVAIYNTAFFRVLHRPLLLN